MTIYQACFRGRRVNSIGIFGEYRTFCWGDTPEEATINLYDRYEHISGLKLTETEIKTVDQCKPRDRIYMVENGQLIGFFKPRESFYIVCDKNDIVCSGEYQNHITCQNGAGVLVPIHGGLTCIVADDTQEQ